MTNKFAGLAERVIMRNIGRNLPVPFPEELCDGYLVYQKDYRMNEFPRTPTGNIWYDISDEKYLLWLAGYLPNNIPELTPEQEKIKANHKKSAGVMSCFWMGDIAGWYENEAQLRPNYDYPLEFSKTGDFASVTLRDNGYSYEDYVECNEGILDPGESLLTREELILDEYGWHLVLEDEKLAFQRHWSNFDKVESYFMCTGETSLHCEPPDAGWRIYLGLALQMFDSRKKRITELEEFYNAWHEMILK